jgi:hypothetical protein
MKKLANLQTFWRASPKTPISDWKRDVPYCGEDAFFITKKNHKFFLGIGMYFLSTLISKLMELVDGEMWA